MYRDAANDRVSQIEAGRAYVRLNLKATELGVAIALVLAFVGWALFWFLTDDAFITFRYAANAMAGRGVLIGTTRREKNVLKIRPPLCITADEAQIVKQHVALGDTIGSATPFSIKEVFRDLGGVTPIAHFHDTRGTGLVNYVAAYEAGVRYFDSSFGGVGGHPAKVKYGGGHTGNVCSEDLVHLFESMGIDTGIDLDGLLATAALCERTLGRELHGRVARSGLSPLLPG